MTPSDGVVFLPETLVIEERTNRNQIRDVVKMTSPMARLEMVLLNPLPRFLGVVHLWIGGYTGGAYRTHR